MNQTDLQVTQLQVSSQSPLKRLQRGSVIAGMLGLLASVAGLFFNPEQFWQSYLLAYIFWLEIALGCLGVVLLHHLVGGHWSLAIQRLMEAGSMTLPLMALLFVPLLLGSTTLYSWTDAEHVAHSELLQLKSGYLNMPFFLIRAVIYFIIWLGFAYLLTRWSRSQDLSGDPNLTLRMRRLSAVGMILFVLTGTFAAYDWMMSLEPEWFSSIYGLLFIAGQALAAFALAIIGLRFISKYKPEVAEPLGLNWTNCFNDLGNFLLGFVMIWAYFAFSQFLIIWSANLPEEAIWYYHRSEGGWLQVGLFLVLLHFVLPFFLLLSRRLKRTAALLTGLAVIIFISRLVDLYWLIMPAFYPNQLHVHWLDVALLVAIGGGWIAVFIRQLAGAPLLPHYDPRSQEITKHEQNEEFASL